MNRFAIALLAGVSAVSMASAVSAADLIISEPVPSVPIVETAGGNWDGIYVGAFAGYGWGTVGVENDVDVIAPIDTDYDADGWQLGVAAGANFTIAEALVAGIVADIAWSDINGGSDEFADVSYNIDWQGSVRGRLGIDAGAFMPYVTAGLAFANNTATVDFGDTFEDSNLHVGWTVGAGVEVAVADNVSLDLLYRYSDFGSQDYSFDGSPATELSLTSHAITAGVNFKF